jgi:hypothetical protein
MPMLRMCDNDLRSASVTSLSVLCALVWDRSNADCGRGLTHPCQPLHAAASACCRPLLHAYAGKLPVAAVSILSSLHAAKQRCGADEAQRVCCQQRIGNSYTPCGGLGRVCGSTAPRKPALPPPEYGSTVERELRVNGVCYQVFGHAKLYVLACF